jgi:hypothetical protein
LATVRIYRVAELLNTTSQEVMALLKRDHGIEVKSASSTIEEVVGRQFVDRLARQRGVTLPSGDVFAEGAAAKAAPKKPSLVKKGGAPEPVKPAAPSLGPPRLVKAAKAIHQAERAAAASHELDGDAVAEHEPTDIHDTHAEAEVDHAPVEEVPVTHVTHAPEPEHEVELPVAEFPAVETADTDTLAAEAVELPLDRLQFLCEVADIGADLDAECCRRRHSESPTTSARLWGSLLCAVALWS